MANEITFQILGQLINGNLTDNIALSGGSLRVDQASAEIDAGVINVGTSEQAISLANLTTLGYVFILNLDATNFVKFGPDNTTLQDLGKLKPGEFALFRLVPGITLKMIADTAACEVLVKAWND